MLHFLLLYLLVYHGEGEGGGDCQQKWLRLLLMSKVKDILFTFIHE